MGRIIVRDEVKTPMTDDNAGPLIAIVGRTQSDDGDVETVRAAAEGLGKALAERGCRLAVYSSKEPCAEPDVVRGYLDSGKAGEDSIVVYYSGEEPIFTTTPQCNRCFKFIRDQRSNWQLSYYESLRSVDGLLLIHGGPSVLTAGIVARMINLPMLCIVSFGGSAEEVWRALEAGKDVATADEIALMGRPWRDGSSNDLVDCLLEQGERKRNEVELEDSNEPPPETQLSGSPADLLETQSSVSPELQFKMGSAFVGAIVLVLVGVMIFTADSAMIRTTSIVLLGTACGLAIWMFVHGNAASGKAFGFRLGGAIAGAMAIMFFAEWAWLVPKPFGPQSGEVKQQAGDKTVDPDRDVHVLKASLMSKTAELTFGTGGDAETVIVVLNDVLVKDTTLKVVLDQPDRKPKKARNQAAVEAALLPALQKLAEVHAGLDAKTAKEKITAVELETFYADEWKPSLQEALKRKTVELTFGTGDDTETIAVELFDVVVEDTTVTVALEAPNTKPMKTRDKVAVEAALLAALRKAAVDHAGLDAQEANRRITAVKIDSFIADEWTQTASGP